jgi:hypothetical protein
MAHRDIKARKMGRIIGAAFAVLAAGGLAPAATLPNLYTPPIYVGNGGNLICSVMNVNSQPRQVAIVVYDSAGSAVAKQQFTLASGANEALAFGPPPYCVDCDFSVQYTCAFDLKGSPKTDFRAEGTANSLTALPAS